MLISRAFASFASVRYDEDCCRADRTLNVAKKGAVSQILCKRASFGAYFLGYHSRA